MYLLTVVGGRFISYLPDLTMWTDLVHLGRIALVSETFGDVFINWLKIIKKTEHDTLYGSHSTSLRVR